MLHFSPIKVTDFLNLHTENLKFTGIISNRKISYFFLKRISSYIAEQHVPANCQPNPTLRPDNSTHSLPLDQSDFLPRLKLYSIQSPVTRVLALEGSPVIRRKSQTSTRVSFLHNAANQESTVWIILFVNHSLKINCSSTLEVETEN